MSLFLEYHLIQNFAPSNLNRDDTGSPKDAIFGGQRRARVSSQCWKRATRLAVKEHGLLPAASLGVRTRKLKGMLLERLGSGRAEGGGAIVDQALAAAGLDVKADDKTEYLLFLGEAEVAALAALVDRHWDALKLVGETKEIKEAKEEPDKKGKSKADKKKEKKASLPPEIVQQAKALLDGGKAVDLALFGRMLADLPSVNRDAACQVAHAISTHRVEREFDFFTAVDDRGDDGDGAGMMGQVEFNSATLYRYAVLDIQKLFENLQRDRDLTLQAVEAFTRALAIAIPTGKQNSFAAHNPPEFAGVCLRHAAPLNLANAFEKPVFARIEQGLTAQSVERLMGYEGKVSPVYGSPGDQWFALDLTGAWPAERGEAVKNLAELSRKARDLAAENLSN